MANVQCNDTDNLCGELCEDPVIPSVNFSDCDPEVNESEIEWVAIANADADDFEDIEDIDEWTTRINQTAPVNPSVPDNTIRMLHVIGDKPAPEETEIAVSGRRTISSSTTHTINLDIDETNAVNYEFNRKTPCIKRVKAWYITVGGKVYGGTCGLKNAALKTRLIQNRGEGEIEKYTGTLTWKDRLDPPRADWPLAGTTGFQTPTT